MYDICDLCKKPSENMVIYNETVKVCRKCNSRKKKTVLHLVGKVLFEIKNRKV